jgi:hypothetical protein
MSGPTVGGGGGGGETLVGEVEPSGARVVEVSERALGEVLGALFVFGDEAVEEVRVGIRH